MINVINLIDGVDGLAAGVCVISALTLAVIALSLDRTAAGVLAALTAGASLGFLRHGFPPATHLHGRHRLQPARLPARRDRRPGSAEDERRRSPSSCPLIVLAVPILDTGFVVAKRLKYRRPIYKADRWHFHHRMANIGFSQRRTLLYLYGWTLVMAALALALRFVPYSDDHGHFDALWTAVIGGLRPARDRRQRLPGLGAGDPQAAPGAAAPAGQRCGARPGAPEPAAAGGRPGGRAGARDRQLPGGRSGDGGVRGDRARTPLAAGSGNPHEVPHQKAILGPFRI